MKDSSCQVVDHSFKNCKYSRKLSLLKWLKKEIKTIQIYILKQPRLLREFVNIDLLITIVWLLRDFGWDDVNNIIDNLKNNNTERRGNGW